MLLVLLVVILISVATVPLAVVSQSTHLCLSDKLKHDTGGIPPVHILSNFKNVQHQWLNRHIDIDE